jgi:hypothetical protein
MSTLMLEDSMLEDYRPPTVDVVPPAALQENQAWFVVPIGIAAYFGGAALWCKYVCRGNGGVKSCAAHYVVNIKAVCRR